MGFEEGGAFLAGIRRLGRGVDLTVAVHDAGRAVAARYGPWVHDAMIVGAAIVAGSGRVVFWDMQGGLVVAGVVRVVDPFKTA